MMKSMFGIKITVYVHISPLQSSVEVALWNHPAPRDVRV